MILQITAVEEIHYTLTLEIDDDLWARIKASPLPLDVLSELIGDDDAWFADQLSEANCAACNDCPTPSVHMMTGVEQRDLYYPPGDWFMPANLEAADQNAPAVRIPHQRTWAMAYFDE